MAVASWRGQVGNNVWWTSHWDGSTEIFGNSFTGQRLDQCPCGSRSGISKTQISSSNSFLRDDNKIELFHLLADKICDAQTTRTIIVTKGEDVNSNTRKCLDAMSPCSYEEADNRIFVHARDAAMEGIKSSSPSSSMLMTLISLL